MSQPDQQMQGGAGHCQPPVTPCSWGGTPGAAPPSLEAVDESNAQEEEEPDGEIREGPEASLCRELLPPEAQLLPPRPQ